MLSAQYTKNTEDLNTIGLVQIEKPVPRSGHVVVRVHAASINPVDIMVHEVVPSVYKCDFSVHLGGCESAF